MFNAATIWVLIPLVAIVGGFITKWMRINAENDLRMKAVQSADAELVEAVRKLEQRVANLERAATTTETERKFAL